MQILKSILLVLCISFNTFPMVSTVTSMCQQVGKFLCLVKSNPMALQQPQVVHTLISLDHRLLQAILIKKDIPNFTPVFAKKSSDYKFLKTIHGSRELLLDKDIQKRFFSLSKERIAEFVLHPENEHISDIISQKSSNNLFKHICSKADSAFLKNPNISKRIQQVSIFVQPFIIVKNAYAFISRIIEHLYGSKNVSPECELFINNLSQEMGITKSFTVKQISQDILQQSPGIKAITYYDCIFLNEKYFTSISELDQKSLIAHELRHIQLNHGFKKAALSCLDIVRVTLSWGILYFHSKWIYNLKPGLNYISPITSFATLASLGGLLKHQLDEYSKKQSHDFELEADRFANQFMISGSNNQNGYVSFLKGLSQGNTELEIISTDSHPSILERINALESHSNLENSTCSIIPLSINSKLLKSLIKQYTINPDNLLLPQGIEPGTITFLGYGGYVIYAGGATIGTVVAPVITGAAVGYFVYQGGKLVYYELPNIIRTCKNIKNSLLSDTAEKKSNNNNGEADALDYLRHEKLLETFPSAPDRLPKTGPLNNPMLIIEGMCDAKRKEIANLLKLNSPKDLLSHAIEAINLNDSLNGRLEKSKEYKRLLELTNRDIKAITGLDLGALKSIIAKYDISVKTLGQEYNDKRKISHKWLAESLPQIREHDPKTQKGIVSLINLGFKANHTGDRDSLNNIRSILKHLYNFSVEGTPSPSRLPIPDLNSLDIQNILRKNYNACERIPEIPKMPIPWANPISHDIVMPGPCIGVPEMPLPTCGVPNVNSQPIGCGNGGIALPEPITECNYSKNPNLPSIIDSVITEGSPDMEPNDPSTEIIDQIGKTLVGSPGIIGIAIESIKPDSDKDISSEVAHEENTFISDVLDLLAIERLKEMYDPELVSKALDAHRVKITDLSWAKVGIEKTIETIKLLKFIKDKNKMDFLVDADHNGKLEKKNINEAITAIAAIDQGFFDSLIRSTVKKVDFYDKHGNKWDVKEAGSIARDGRYFFNIVEFINGIKEELTSNEGILVNISNLKAQDLSILTSRLIKEFTPEQLKNILMIDCNNSFRSKKMN